MPQAGISHHITISDIDGSTNKTGFMLAKRRNGQLVYEVADAEQIQARILTMGELTEAEAPPQLRLYWTEEDWQGGIGGIVHRNDKRKLAASVGVDSSIRGALRPQREFQTPAIDTVPTNPYVCSAFAIQGLSDLWMFLGRHAYKWNFTDEDWDRGQDELQKDYIARNGIAFNDRVVVPVWNNVSPHYVPQGHMQKREADSEWTGVDESTDGARLAKYFTTAIDGSNNLLLWGGNLSSYSGSLVDEGSNVDATQTTIVVDDGTDFAVEDYIVLEAEIIRVTSISTNTLTVVRAQLGSAGATHVNNTIVHDYQPHHIASTTSPESNTGFSSTTDVGTIEAPITAMLQDAGILHVCKTDGVWKIAADGTQTNLLPRLESWRHQDNFKMAYNWNGRMLLPLGTGGLLELVGTTISDVSMKLFAPEQTQWHGRVVAISGTQDTVYLLIHDSANTKYHAFSGIRLNVDGDTDWRWNHVGEISYTTSTVADFATIGLDSQFSGSDQHQRIWFGIYSTGSDVKGFFLPLENDSDDTFSDLSTMKATSVKFDGNFSQIEKNVVEVDFESNNLGASGRKWTISYSLNGASVKTDLKDSGGTADGVIDATSGRETMTFPVGTTCRTLHYELVPASTASTSTAPEITKIRTTFQLRPDRLRLLPITVLLSDQQRLLNGAIGGTLKASLAQLRTWDGQAAGVQVVDLEGTTRDYVFLPGNLRIIPGPKSHTRRREFLVSMVLAEV